VGSLADDRCSAADTGDHTARPSLTYFHAPSGVWTRTRGAGTV